MRTRSARRSSRPGTAVKPSRSGAAAKAAPLAYRWQDGRLAPVATPHRIPLDSLQHVERQKLALAANTRAFVTGKPANHALLTGARGTGKSSLVKAMLGEFAAQGLRLVEVPAPELSRLHAVVAPLRDRDERFILYVDDFSVAAHDPGLAALKGALDGSIEAAPDNVLIYATSNRRHLMPEFHSENSEYRWIEGELHPGESTEEKISLSERFGLWLSFPSFDQEQYLSIVEGHLRALGAKLTDEARTESLRWALERASRSGRSALQFARHWVGQR